MTTIKSLLFLIFVPGLLLGVFPYWLTTNSAPILDFGVLRWAAFLFWFNGFWMTLWCFYEFTLKGHGTPAPIDPPKKLVVSGLYRFMRNPMYMSGAIILSGYVIWHSSSAMMWAQLFFMVSAHLFVVLYEEPVLRKKFGSAYELYCRDVPRWFRLFGKNR